MGKTRFEQFSDIEIDIMDAFFAGRGVTINDSDEEIELYNQLGGTVENNTLTFIWWSTRR